jgi:KaiC/GvpD/RAD55 family RecA-like ATPase
LAKELIMVLDSNLPARQNELTELATISPEEHIPSRCKLEINQKEIRKFADALFRYADANNYVSVRGFAESGSNPKTAAFKIDAAYIDELGLENVICKSIEIAQQAASEERPIVFCPPIATFKNHENPRKAREIDLAQTLALSVECDQHPDKARKQLEALLGPATVVVRSGGEWVDPETAEIQDKLHLHWRFSEPTSIPDDHKLAKEARALATALVGGDATNIPAVHPIRWPGSWHRKGSPRISKIITLNENAEIELSDALEKLRDAVNVADIFIGRVSTTSVGSYEGGDSRDTNLIIKEIITGENYHQSLVTLAMRLLKSGVNDGQAVLIMRGVMEGARDLQLDAGKWDEPRWQARNDTISKAVSSARNKLGASFQSTGYNITLNSDVEAERKLAADCHRSDKLRPRTLDELLNEPERKSIVKGVFSVGEFSVIYGEPKSGKSFLAFDLALSVARGIPWFGRKVVQGAVLYIAAEGTGGIPKRIKAYFKYHSTNADNVPFFAIPFAADLLRQDTTADVNVIIQSIHQIEQEYGEKVQLIVIDTLSRTMPGGDENSAKDMTSYIRNCDQIREQTGAHVTVIHHKPKGSNNTPRGHSSLFGAVDGLILVKKIGEANAWTLEASKDDADGNMEGFELEVIETDFDVDDDPIRSCVVVQVDVEAGNSNKRLTGDKATAMEALQDVMCRDDVQIINNRSGIRPNTRCGSVEAWRKEFYSRAAGKPTQEAKQKAFSRASTSLKDLSLVAYRDDLVWILPQK